MKDVAEVKEMLADCTKALKECADTQEGSREELIYLGWTEALNWILKGGDNT